jgi:D-lyxose ketol-isomerase
MKAKTISTALLSVMLVFTCMSFTLAPKSTKSIKMTTNCNYKKKFTNADFYTNGKFNKEVALKAVLDMFAFYGVEYTDLMKKDMWVTDFNLGDFEHVGMGGIFWVNDAEHNYFGHEIYLLPNQMIPEHAHMETPGHAAKFESWLVRNGSCYNYSIGKASPNAPQLPASQKDFITVSHFVKMKVGDIVPLVKIETKHFLFAGDNGLIVTEFGSYHDGGGLRFTNPNVKF